MPSTAPSFVLPEFTRSLRALAMPTAPGAEHDWVWGPFRQALTAAHRATAVESQVAAFDADRIERGLRSAMTAMAQKRFPKSPADCRALEAELDVAGDPLWKALAQVRDAAKALQRAPTETRAAAWGAWVEALRVMFRAADDWWVEAEGILGARTGGGR